MSLIKSLKKAVFKPSSDRSDKPEVSNKNPIDDDAKWWSLTKSATNHALNGDWGFYRNTKLELAEILREEKKLKSALYFYLDVLYLDLNGPNNLGGMSPALREKCPLFDPKMAMKAPGIIKRISITVKKLGLSAEEVRVLYDEMIKQQYSAIKPPVPPEEAWTVIESEIFKGDDSNRA